MAAGWIILDKESGLFSRTASTRVARLFGEKTSGHIGTLDPMASGVLAIAIGNATKMIPFVEELPNANIKEYLFSVQFGFETDTLDITGRETARNNIIPTESDIMAALPQFIGDISQVPPAFSAVHVNGERAYHMALAGNAPEIAPRTVHIYSLEYLGQQGDTFQFKTRCSRGTYVRSLARDIAAKCGTIATTSMIRRIQSGGFHIKNAVKLDFLENLINNGADFRQYLNPIDFGLGDIPVLNLDDKSAILYRNGGFIGVDAKNGLYRIYSDDAFIGIGRVTDKTLRPKRTI